MLPDAKDRLVKDLNRHVHGSHAPEFARSKNAKDYTTFWSNFLLFHIDSFRTADTCSGQASGLHFPKRIIRCSYSTSAESPFSGSSCSDLRRGPAHLLGWPLALRFVPFTFQMCHLGHSRWLRAQLLRYEHMCGVALLAEGTETPFESL